jgi:hypothetical protein
MNPEANLMADAAVGTTMIFAELPPAALIKCSIADLS